MTRKTPATQKPHALPLWAIWLIAAVAVFTLSALSTGDGAGDCAIAPPMALPEV